jgi:hypothetical protein
MIEKLFPSLQSKKIKDALHADTYKKRDKV